MNRNIKLGEMLRQMEIPQEEEQAQREKYKNKAEIGVLQDELFDELFIHGADELIPEAVENIKKGKKAFNKFLSNLSNMLVTPDDSRKMRYFKAKAKVDARFLTKTPTKFSGDPFNYDEIDTYIEGLSTEIENEVSTFDQLMGRTGRDENGRWIYNSGPSSSWEQTLMEQYICELLHQYALADSDASFSSDSFKNRNNILLGVNYGLLVSVANHSIIEAKKDGLSQEDLALQRELFGSSTKALTDDTSNWELLKASLKKIFS